MQLETKCRMQTKSGSSCTTACTRVVPIVPFDWHVLFHWLSFLCMCICLCQVRPLVISLPYVGLLPSELWDGIWNCPIGQPTVDRQLTLACAICQTHLLDSFQTITFQFRVVRLQGDDLLEYLKPIQCWETHARGTRDRLMWETTEFEETKIWFCVVRFCKPGCCCAHSCRKLAVGFQNGQISLGLVGKEFHSITWVAEAVGECILREIWWMSNEYLCNRDEW